MSGSWGIFINGNTSVCAAYATPPAFLGGSSVSYSARDGLNKINISTIPSVLKIFPTEVYLINRFFMPSTSLILLSDQNISCWIRSVTARIHSENIWDYGSSEERYPDPEFILERASMT